MENNPDETQAGQVKKQPPSGEDRVDAIALKYLELSRAEILERLKLSNQFLIVYLGGISALLGWLFTAKDPMAGGIVPQNVLPAVAAGFSFLACSVSWILSENEAMIELHAKYQMEQLGKWLYQVSSLLLWEETSHLRNERPSTGAMLAHVLMINAPNIALTIAAAFLPSPQLPGYCLRMALIALSFVLTAASVVISIRMIRRRTGHRRSIRDRF
ncbi:MAG TPA: hypothetical protein VHZ52_07865 [Acidobacteriaceae bacterium]|jgi:hypothetical protein|nr:hypothetical protein [Acidobacteriaceae bacterium]